MSGSVGCAFFPSDIAHANVKLTSQIVGVARVGSGTGGSADPSWLPPLSDGSGSAHPMTAVPAWNMYEALLRGVNVGGCNPIRIDQLRPCLEDRD